MVWFLGMQKQMQGGIYEVMAGLIWNKQCQSYDRSFEKLGNVKGMSASVKRERECM